MNFHISIERKFFDFKSPAKTSRNIFNEKEFLVVTLKDSNGMIGSGEIAPLTGLSPETVDDCEHALNELQDEDILQILESKDLPSSVRFGLEMAIAELNSNQKHIYFPNGIASLESGIPINGLIWMGDKNYMVSQVQKKIEQDFSCIKVKIGGITWREEMEIIMLLREMGGPNLEIRLDANGAFTKNEFREKWNALSGLGIHSIEQPLAVGHHDEMRELARSGVPVALDEEMIGCEDKVNLLEACQPKFIALKPTLHGGFTGVEEWIKFAEERKIGWWITSALESNLGLSAIAQFAAQYDNVLAQGLGTGELFKNNFETPLKREGQRLFWKD